MNVLIIPFLLKVFLRIILRLIKFLFLIFFAFSQLCLGKELAESNPSPSSEIRLADSYYAMRGELSYAYLALAIYKKHLDQNPRSQATLWRLSMAHYYIGHLLTNKRQRKEYFSNGVKYGKKCVKDGNSPLVECYFWWATNAAFLKQEQGVFQLAFGISKLFHLFHKSAELNPYYAGAGAYRMLAILHYKAPGFLGGSLQKALGFIQKANEIAKNEPLNYYYFAKLLIRDNRKEEALTITKTFIAAAKPENFEFFESYTAFKNLKSFLATGILPHED